MIIYMEIGQITNTHVLHTLKSLISKFGGERKHAAFIKKYGINAVKLKTMKFILRNTTK